jgi:hypothetical protein
MITEDDFLAAADCPPDLAFVRLERKFREMLESNLESSHDCLRLDRCANARLCHR